MDTSKSVSFESLESRQLRSVSLPTTLGDLLGQTIGTTASQPALAANGVHRVVATTQQGVGLLDGTEVYAQRLDAAGNAVGQAIHVNDITLGNQSDPKVAIAQDGSFVVSYLSGTAAYVRQFAADGTPKGAAQRVSNVLDNVTDVNLAQGTDGKFLVTYVTTNLLTGKDIYSKLFNADGTAVTAAALLNTNTIGDQLAPAIAALPGGQYVTAFQSNLGNGQGFDIVMQRLDALGNTLGTNTIVNTLTAGDQLAPALAYDAASNAIALAYSTVNGADASDIAMQLFNTDGTVKSPTQIVNTVTSGLQTAPSIGITDAGTMAISYLNQATNSTPLNGVLTTLDGNGLNLGDTDLGSVGTGTANLPVVGGATSKLLTALSTGTGGTNVSTQEISLQPLSILGTSQDDTVVILPGIGQLTITLNGVITNPLIGDFNKIVINTGAGNDSVTVANLLNLLGNIAVSVDAGDGNDTLMTGDSSDTLLGGLGNDLIDSGDGADYIVTGAGDDTVDAGAGNDKIFGGNGNNSLLGGAGNDWFNDITGTDTLDGGDGVDTISFANAVRAVRIDLTGAADSGIVNQLDTITNFENATGSAFNDTIIGNALANLLSGGAGNDTIDGGLGTDILYGGAGVDTVSYASRLTGVTITLDGSPDSGAAGENDDIAADFENVLGGAGDDLIVGNGVANKLIGGDGNDTLVGQDGNDQLFGEAGNDYIDGGNGADYISGLSGNDTITAGHGSDQIFGDAGNDFLQGGPGRDSIWGGDGADRVKAGSGNDSIMGDAGNDSLYGDTGDDYIEGDDGNDTLYGGTGKDAINGNSGSNVLFGQSGSDTLTATEGTDTVNGGPSRDTGILDSNDTRISVEILD